MVNVILNTATTEEADVIKEATGTEEERFWYDYMIVISKNQHQLEKPTKDT